MKESCGAIMTKDPMCCTPQDTVQRAAELMKDRSVGSIPVCESQDSKRLVGILTDRDLTLKILAEGRDPRKTRVSEVMTRKVFACREQDDLQKALEMMEEHQVRRVPVVDADNRILGIISQADIATRLKSPQKTAEVVTEISKPRAKAA